MQLLDVYAQLKNLKQPTITTRELAGLLKIKNATASKILIRLSEHGLLVHLKHGLWGMTELIDKLMLPGYLTAPFPGYISLQSALYYHGMITQIPEVIYAVSLARTKQITTPLATVSIHHVQANFFFGFETIGKHNIKMATPEKALLDIAYLSTAKSKLFASLPELELPEIFDTVKLVDMLQKIQSKNRRSIIIKYLHGKIPMLS
ncbi:MAG: hypothetical protein KAT71_05530 [Gammaproteobacteria bacterium]|nr:hypothetical protein [Gammaproteobacteria bacterium]